MPDINKAVIVTGGSRGIGRRIVARLLEEAWVVFNPDREPPNDLPSDPFADTWIEADLSDVAALDGALRRILREGPVVGLVNNAAIARAANLEQTTQADFDLTGAVNVRAPMLCAQALVPGMRDQGFGRIVNISSRAHLGKTLRTAYAASKGAIISMTRVWALEYAADGITCNAVAPGPVRTELFEQVNPPDHPRTAAILDSIPVGRLGEPDDIANAVAFFMDEKASYITGQVLYVCGGVTLTRGGS